MRRAARWWGACITFALGCGGPAPGADDDAADDTTGDDDSVPADPVAFLTGAGPYSVGYRQSAVTYADPAGDGDRTLRLALWYPTGATTGDHPLYNGFFPSDAAWTDAPPAEGGPWPVALFSHGHQGYAENSSFLMEHLASHGWLVAAPDHTGNTTADGSDRTTAIYLQRPQDLSAVLDALLDLAEEDPLRDAAGSPVLAMGHSFGGYTVTALAGATYDMDTLVPACAGGTGPPSFCSTLDADLEQAFRAGLADPRFALAISLAPGDFDLFGAAGVGAIDRPFGLFYGDLDPGFGNWDLFWPALAPLADPVGLLVHGGAHNVFTDYSGILDSGDGLIDASAGFAITRGYTLALALHAQGRDWVGAVLDGTVALDPQAEVFLHPTARPAGPSSDRSRHFGAP